MFSKKEDITDIRSFSKTKTNMFNISKFQGARSNGLDLSTKNKQLSIKSSNIPDLSLNILTK